MRFWSHSHSNINKMPLRIESVHSRCSDWVRCKYPDDKGLKYKNGWKVLVTLELGYEKGKAESGFSATQNITGRGLCISLSTPPFNTVRFKMDFLPKNGTLGKTPHNTSEKVDLYFHLLDQTNGGNHEQGTVIDVIMQQVCLL
jgi:hypothetical protein